MQIIWAACYSVEWAPPRGSDLIDTGWGLTKGRVIWEAPKKHCPVPRPFKLPVLKLTHSPSRYLWAVALQILKKEKMILSHYAFSPHLHEAMDLREL